MDSEGNPPYPRVAETLERLSTEAEIVVVSSSSRETLEKDWGNAGLLSSITRVEGQEQGSKSRQLTSSLNENRSPTHALMIGDALGDLEAAREHGILFYPIIPGEEVLSWERFEAEAIDRFIEGAFAGEYEKNLLADFESVLLPDDKVFAKEIPTR
jgi:beta-phosphoglucomutase-like phosphatase (HAD superfamily)